MRVAPTPSGGTHIAAIADCMAHVNVIDTERASTERVQLVLAGLLLHQIDIASRYKDYYALA